MLSILFHGGRNNIIQYDEYSESNSAPEENCRKGGELRRVKDVLSPSLVGHDGLENHEHCVPDCAINPLLNLPSTSRQLPP